MISLIHANYSEWKLIKRNYVSANEDLGLCPSYNIICTVLAAGYFHSAKISQRSPGMPFIFKLHRQNHHLCVGHKLAVIGRAIKTSVRRMGGETSSMTTTQRRVFLEIERALNTDGSLLQNIPSVPPVSSALCPNDVHTAAMTLISSPSRAGKLSQKHSNYLSSSFSCQPLLHLTMPAGGGGSGRGGGSSRAGPLAFNCRAPSASICLDRGFAHQGT